MGAYVLEELTDAHFTGEHPKIPLSAGQPKKAGSQGQAIGKSNPE